MKQLIIGFGHKRQRGKDTGADHVVDFLVQRHKCSARRDFFARSLKEGIGKYVFGLNEDQLYGELKTAIDDFWNLTPRDILQRSGTEAMRDTFGPDIWVKTVLRRIHQDPKTHVVISDVRFPNEAQAIREWGGVLIKVKRDIDFLAGVDEHASETALDDWHDWDYIVDNNDTIEEYFSKLDQITTQIVRDSYAQ